MVQERGYLPFQLLYGQAGADGVWRGECGELVIFRLWFVRCGDVVQGSSLAHRLR